MSGWLTVLRLVSFSAMCAASDGDVKWLVQYDGKALPQEQGWVAVGAEAMEARLVEGSLRIIDDSAEEMGCFRAVWRPDPSQETIVEVRTRVNSVTANRGGTSMWPSVEGAPTGLLVSDGRRQEGLVLRPDKVATFMDRVYRMDARREFHTYRLVIRGGDMSVYVDGQRRIVGEGAFWKPADSSEAFVQFGSNSRPWLGQSEWSYVKLGVRPAQEVRPASKLRITLSQPWDIPNPPGTRCTRPYLYNVGQGVLLMSVAQGPDKFYEPYGVLKSTDEGRTWTPVPDLQEKTFAPQIFVREPGEEILGVSRWNVRYDDGVHVGMSFRFDAAANGFRMFEHRILTPPDLGSDNLLICERQIFDVGGGRLLASVRNRQRSRSTRPASESFLMATDDGGQTWKLLAPIGAGGEPTVARLSPTEMTALLRTGGWAPFEQRWSHDGGKTWTPPATLEEGSVDADLEVMSNGVLACSYGRPGSCLMFSTDGGKTWGGHQVITDEKGYHYTSVCEVRPGRLLYVHDAPQLRALHVDVERAD